MGVPAWTTPTFTLTFQEPALDLTTATNVYVTFNAGFVTITKTGEELTVSEKQIVVSLSQEECGKFGETAVNIQANWTDASGQRCASDVSNVDITKQLLKKVVI